MATTLFAQAYAPYLALGIGGLGGRAAAAGCLDGFGEKVPWAACDTQASRLLGTGLERKLRLDLPRAARPEFYARALEAQAEPMRRLLRKKELVLLFGALEEPSCVPIMNALASYLRREHRDVCAIGLEPLMGASEAHAGPGGCGLVLRLSPAVQMMECVPGTPANRLSRLGEESLSFAIEALLAALVGCDSAPGLTFGELRAFLLGGPSVSVVGAAQGPDAVLAAFEQALACGASECGGGMAVAIASGRECSLLEMQTIRARLAETAGSASACLLGFGTDPTLGDDSRCLLMQRPRLSRNVISLNG